VAPAAIHSFPTRRSSDLKSSGSGCSFHYHNCFVLYDCTACWCWGIDSVIVWYRLLDCSSYCRCDDDNIRPLWWYDGNKLGADNEGGIIMARMVIIAFLVLWQYNFNIGTMFTEVKSATVHGADYLKPGLKYKEGLGTISLMLALVLGTSGLPHI